MAAITRRLRIRPAVQCRDFAPDLIAIFDLQVTGRLATGASVVAPMEQLQPSDDHRCSRTRPCCVPDHAVVWGVGTARCGCAAVCGCGCQDGNTCRCHASVA
ncbi:hypothetical protein [Amycolatopsis sp. NBC_01480]|uniref:hypothetical protein n=1 Tax=Amycolatopsis sp. NBC_01480 TaxID=2903562 RepID=UPI002E2C95BF|nr:hypothetical protein [Amycolatopsis sp. NBC_01480]